MHIWISITASDQIKILLMKMLSIRILLIKNENTTLMNQWAGSQGVVMVIQLSWVLATCTLTSGSSVDHWPITCFFPGWASWGWALGVSAAQDGLLPDRNTRLKGKVLRQSISNSDIAIDVMSSSWGWGRYRTYVRSNSTSYKFASVVIWQLRLQQK